MKRSEMVKLLGLQMGLTDDPSLILEVLENYGMSPPITGFSGNQLGEWDKESED